VIYVPVYQPDYVYYQSGVGIGFGAACAIGPWLDCDFDWAHHNLRYWDHDHRRPAGWWQERPDQRQAWMASQTTVWHSQSYHGFTPANRRDRGWNNQVANHPAPTTFQAQMTQTRERQQQAQQQIQQRTQEVQQHNTTVFNQSRPAPAFHPEANGAFTGSESSRDARTFSDRGQQSMEVTHSEPTQPHYEAPQPHYEAPPQPHYEAPQTHYEAPVSPPAPAFESGGGGGESHGRR